MVTTYLSWRLEAFVFASDIKVNFVCKWIKINISFHFSLYLTYCPSFCVPQFFVLDVYNSDGSPLTVDQIYVQLEKIWNTSLQTNKEPVGILTSNHRNTWGKAYNNLIKGELSGKFHAVHLMEPLYVNRNRLRLFLQRLINQKFI